MAILKQQENWNKSVQIGPQPEESVSQSFFFEKTIFWSRLSFGFGSGYRNLF